MRLCILTALLLLAIFSGCKTNRATLQETAQLESRKEFHEKTDTINDTLQIFHTIHEDTITRTITQYKKIILSARRKAAEIDEKDTVYILQKSEIKEKPRNNSMSSAIVVLSFLILGVLTIGIIIKFKQRGR